MNKFIKNKKIIMSLVFIFVFLFPSNSFAVTEGSGFEIELNIIGCNNNTVCEPGSGEDAVTCPNDCLEIEPEPEDGSTGSGSGIAMFDFFNFEISPDVDSVRISWETTRPALNHFYWGNSINYELGGLAEASYKKEHFINIYNLDSNTQYYFTISAKDKFGREKVYNSIFKTSPISLYTFPENISNLKTKKIEEGILFNWKNPNIDDFSSVRVVKKEGGFPRGPLDGRVLYEGGSNNFTDYFYDSEKVYYYGFFVRNIDGRYSSGVLLKIDPESFIKESVLDGETGIEIDTDYVGGLNLSINDFNFKQGESILFPTDGRVEISNNVPIYISVPSNLVPKNSTIIFTSENNYSEINEISMLLRLEEDGSRYSGVFLPSYTSGLSSFNLKIYDRALNLINVTEGEFFIPKKEFQTDSNRDEILVYLLILIVLFVVIFIIKKTEKKS